MRDHGQRPGGVSLRNARQGRPRVDIMLASETTQATISKKTDVVPLVCIVVSLCRRRDGFLVTSRAINGIK